MRGSWIPTRARPCLERQPWPEREAQSSSVGGVECVRQEAEQRAVAPAAGGWHEAGGAGAGLRALSLQHQEVGGPAGQQQRSDEHRVAEEHEGQQLPQQLQHVDGGRGRHRREREARGPAGRGHSGVPGRAKKTVPPLLPVSPPSNGHSASAAEPGGVIDNVDTGGLG